MIQTRNTDNADKICLWLDAWDRFAPDALKSLCVRHKGAGGEFAFAKQETGRGWLLDWCIPTLRVAVEVDGAMVLVKKSPKTGRWYPVGHHNTPDNFDKHNTATSLGWAVFHFAPKMLATEEQKETAVGMVSAVVQERYLHTCPEGHGSVFVACGARKHL